MSVEDSRRLLSVDQHGDSLSDEEMAISSSLGSQGHSDFPRPPPEAPAYSDDNDDTPIHQEEDRQEEQQQQQQQQQQVQQQLPRPADAIEDLPPIPRNKSNTKKWKTLCQEFGIHENLVKVVENEDDQSDDMIYQSAGSETTDDDILMDPDTDPTVGGPGSIVEATSLSKAPQDDNEQILEVNRIEFNSIIRPDSLDSKDDEKKEEEVKEREESSIERVEVKELEEDNLEDKSQETSGAIDDGKVVDPNEQNSKLEVRIELPPENLEGNLGNENDKIQQSLETMESAQSELIATASPAQEPQNPQTLDLKKPPTATEELEQDKAREDHLGNEDQDENGQGRQSSEVVESSHSELIETAPPSQEPQNPGKPKQKKPPAATEELDKDKARDDHIESGDQDENDQGQQYSEVVESAQSELIATASQSQEPQNPRKRKKKKRKKKKNPTAATKELGKDNARDDHVGNDDQDEEPQKPRKTRKKKGTKQIKQRQGKSKNRHKKAGHVELEHSSAVALEGSIDSMGVWRPPRRASALDPIHANLDSSWHSQSTSNSFEEVTNFNWVTLRTPSHDNRNTPSKSDHIQNEIWRPKTKASDADQGSKKVKVDTDATRGSNQNLSSGSLDKSLEVKPETNFLSISEGLSRNSNSRRTQTKRERRKIRRQQYIDDRECRQAIVIQAAARGHLARFKFPMVKRSARIINTSVHRQEKRPKALGKTNLEPVAPLYSSVPVNGVDSIEEDINLRQDYAFEKEKYRAQKRHDENENRVKTGDEQKEDRKRAYLKDQQKLNSIRIQSVIRGYKARKSYKKRLGAKNDAEKAISNETSSTWIKPKIESAMPKVSRTSKTSCETNSVIPPYDRSLYLRQRMHNDEHESQMKSIAEIYKERRKMYLRDLERRESIKIQAVARGHLVRKRFTTSPKQRKKREKNKKRKKKSKSKKIDEDEGIPRSQTNENVTARARFDRASYLQKRLQRDENERQLKSITEIQAERLQIYVRDLERREAIRIQAVVRAYNIRKRHPNITKKRRRRAALEKQKKRRKPKRQKSTFEKVRSFFFGEPKEKEGQIVSTYISNIERGQTETLNFNEDGNFFGFEDPSCKEKTDRTIPRVNVGVTELTEDQMKKQLKKLDALNKALFEAVEGRPMPTVAKDNSAKPLLTRKGKTSKEKVVQRSTYSNDFGVSWWQPSVGKMDHRVYRDSDDTCSSMKREQVYVSPPPKCATTDFWQAARREHLPATSSSWLPPSRVDSISKLSKDDNPWNEGALMKGSRPLMLPYHVDFAGEMRLKESLGWAPNLPSRSKGEISRVDQAIAGVLGKSLAIDASTNAALKASESSGYDYNGWYHGQYNNFFTR